jgi:putative salt-induced outer membrane protein YdiY
LVVFVGGQILEDGSNNGKEDTMKGAAARGDTLVKSDGSARADGRKGIRRSLGGAILCVLLLLLAPCLAGADEVTMANGDVITGEIVGLKDGKLTIKTPYNEALEVAWGSIAKIVSEAPVEVVLSDETRLKGTLQMSEDGVLQVVTETAGAVAVGDMASITDINPPVVPAVTYEGNLEAGASYLTGNTDTTSANLSALFVARSKRQRFTLRGRWYYAENNKEVSAREAGGSAKYDFFMTEKLYLYANALFDYNPFKDLDLRSTFGGGLGYQFFEDVRKKLNIELGVSYIDENFRIAPDNSYAGGRWSIGFDYKVIPDQVAFFHFQEGYFSLEDFKDMNLRSEQGLRFTVLKDFYTTIQVNVAYDHLPSPGFKKTDTALIFGLGYNFNL